MCEDWTSALFLSLFSVAWLDLVSFRFCGVPAVYCAYPFIRQGSLASVCDNEEKYIVLSSDGKFNYYISLFCKRYADGKLCMRCNLCSALVILHNNVVIYVNFLNYELRIFTNCRLVTNDSSRLVCLLFKSCSHSI